MMASDGVWDVFSSLDAYKETADLTTAIAVAKEITAQARQRRRMEGMHMDDITTLVIDINTGAKVSLGRAWLAQGGTNGHRDRGAS